MSNLKLNNVLSTGENTFIIRMTLSELKDLIDFETIKIDLKKEVPYVPLEDEGIIYLNIDKNSISYNKNDKILNVTDKFKVLDGEVRLINFINDIDRYEDKMDKIITLNIVCCDIYTARKSFFEVNKIPVNREAIKNIANEIKITINDSNDDFSKVITIPVNKKTRKTIEKLDQAHRNMINEDVELEAKFQEVIEGLKKIFESVDEEENK